MTTLSAPLRGTVRPRVILRYLGQLTIVAAGASVVPCGVALLLGDVTSALSFLTVGVVLGLVGLGCSRVDAPGQIQVNEAMTLSALIFVVVSLAACYPMIREGLTVSEALFEGVSAVTTTGLSTLGTMEGRSQSFLFARAWIQWCGGLGIVVLSLAFVTTPSLAAKRLALPEMDDKDLVGGTRAFATKTLVVYGGLTAAGIAVFLLMGGEAFEAVTYTLAAVSTGGFAPVDASLAGLGAGRLEWTVMLFCMAGAIPLLLYYHGVRERGRNLLKNPQLWGLAACTLLMVVLVAGSMHLLDGFRAGEALRHGSLLAMSAQSTAGFSSMDVGQLGPASKLLLIVSMAVGGSIGSTAGGFKVLRLLILLEVIRTALVKTSMPAHGVLHHSVAGQKLEDGEIQEALLLIIIFGGVVAVSWLLFVVSGYDPLDSLFEVVSATGTVGLSTGISGPELPGHLRGVLCVDMLLGRLEFVAWFVVFCPGTWFGGRRSASS